MRVDESEWTPPSGGHTHTHTQPPSPNSVKDCRKWFVRLEVLSSSGALLRNELAVL